MSCSKRPKIGRNEAKDGPYFNIRFLSPQTSQANIQVKDVLLAHAWDLMQVEDEVSSVGDFEPLVPVGQALLLVLLQFIEESGQVYDDPIA